MNGTIDEPLLTFGLAVLLIVSMLFRSLLSKIRVPGLIGFLLIGVAIRAVSGDDGLPEGALIMLDVLGKLGVISLLFRAGLDTNLKELLDQARTVLPVWVANVVFVGAVSFLTTWWLLGMAIVPSLVIAVALTATSVGISVAIWEERGKAGSRAGEVFLGVAGLDDVSAVALMAVLFAIAPELHNGGSSFGWEIAIRLGWTIGKIALFATGCYLFSRFIEGRLRERIYSLESAAAGLLTIVSISIIIASVAGLMGFSVAIGAFFAGLAFSRDPDAVREQTAFDLIYDLFVPFFFIGIGLSINLSVVLSAVGIGLVLLMPAVLGKLLANGLPALQAVGGASAMAIGISMVPRAEITMVVMERARELGAWAASEQSYAAVTFVCLVTAFVAPIVLRRVIRRVPDHLPELRIPLAATKSTTASSTAMTA
jgi:Kef-type K+ transport system membrane component KefB